MAFGSPRQRDATRVSMTTSPSRAAASSARSIVSPDRARGLNSAGCDHFLAASQFPKPRLQVDHCAGVMPEMPEQPPEPLGAAERSVRDDERIGPDPGAGGRSGEVHSPRERMAPAGPGRCGQVPLDVEERCARDMALQIGPSTEVRVIERPPAVDEDIVHL